MSAVALLTIAAHALGLQNGFVLWDDDSHITQNILIRSLSWDNICAMFTQPVAKLYCPLTWLSFALDYRVWGQQAIGYHLTNLALHVANTLLVFSIVCRVVGALVESSTRQSQIAFFAAALFGVHPLRVESVAWATERKDVLYAFFYLLALLVYLRRDRLWLCFALFVCSALAKSAAVTFPIVLLLFDALLLRRCAWLEKLSFFAVSLVIGSVTFLSQRQGIGDTVTSTAVIPLWARAGLVGYCSLFYAEKLLWPAQLCAIYPTFDEMHWSMWRNFGFGIVFVALTLLVFSLRERMPLLWLGWLFYLITLSPTIGLMPVGIHVVADRYSYLPLMGLALPLAACAAKNRLTASVSVALLLLLTVLSARRTAIWENTETLFLATLDSNPRCLPAHINLTKWYTSRGEYAKAIEHGRRAVELAPEGTPGRKNLAIALKRAGLSQEAVQIWPPVADQP